MRPLSIRWRLTLWYSGVLATLLAAFSAAVYLMMRHHFVERADEMLMGEIAEVTSTFAEVGPLERQQQLLQQRFGTDQRYEFEVLDSAGRPVFQSERVRGKSLLGAVHPNAQMDAFADGFWPQGGAMRVAYARVETESGPLNVRIGTSMHPDQQELEHLLWVILLAGPLALLGAVAGGYVLARRAFEPIDRMVATATNLTARQLDRRLTIVNPDDELGRLAQSLNQMIARLEQSFIEMQRFTADAAHELRTPLAIIRNQAEVALRSGRTVEEYRQVLESLLDENDRMARMADQLLYLSREDAGLQSFRRSRVRLDELLLGVVEHMQVLASEKQITLKLECDDASVDGDADRLRRVFYNLIENAIKYTATNELVPEHAGNGNAASKGHIQIGCRTQGLSVRVTVSDNGPGVGPEHVPHIFERFYRVDAARSDVVTGTGLGLAICRSIVESHGGRILFESQPGKGSTVTVVLPQAENAVGESPAAATAPQLAQGTQSASVAHR